MRREHWPHSSIWVCELFSVLFLVHSNEYYCFVLSVSFVVMNDVMHLHFVKNSEFERARCRHILSVAMYLAFHVCVCAARLRLLMVGSWNFYILLICSRCRCCVTDKPYAAFCIDTHRILRIPCYSPLTTPAYTQHSTHTGLNKYDKNVYVVMFLSSFSSRPFSSHNSHTTHSYFSVSFCCFCFLFLAPLRSYGNNFFSRCLW